MITLTIKTITSTDSKKDGTKLISKFGPYFLVRADTLEEGPVTWFSKTAHTQQPGDKITGNLETKVANGFTNKNFSFPKESDVQTERIAKLEGRVTTLELSFERKFAELTAKIKSDVVLETTGKFLTSADYKEYTKAPPFGNHANPLDGIPIEDEPPF